MYDLNLIVPNLNSPKYSADNKFALLKNYLYELNETLSYALSDKEETVIKNLKEQILKNEQSAKSEILILNKNSRERFEELKTEILRTADDICTAYATDMQKTEEEILQKATADFLAKTEFEEYKSQSETKFSQTADKIDLNAHATEAVSAELESYKKISAESLDEYRQASSDELQIYKENARAEFNEYKQSNDETFDTYKQEASQELEAHKDAVSEKISEYKQSTDLELQAQEHKFDNKLDELEEKTDIKFEEYTKTMNAGFTVQSDAILSQVENIFTAKTEAAELEERISSKIIQEADNITESFSEELTVMNEDISSIGGEFADFVNDMDVYIRRGKLDENVYGIEIGRNDSNIKARFTNDRLSFFQGTAEVAYISGNNLYITRAEVLDYLRLGNTSHGFFTFDITEKGLEVRWSDGS